MIVQGLNNISSAYGAISKSAVEGQTRQATASNYAEKVNISGAGMALATNAAMISHPDDPAIISESLDKRSPYYGKYSEKEIFDAQTKLNQQEFMAFGHLAGDASTQGIIKLSEAYLKYINSLSPEAQQTGRYAGTKESVTNLLTQARAKLATENTDPTKKVVEPTSFIMMMLEAMSKSIEGQHPTTFSGE